MKIFILSIFLSIVNLTLVFSQTKSDIELLKKNEHINNTRNWNLGKPESEFELGVRAVFLGYKIFISSQDASTCTFSPSCSVYAVQAIKHKGIILGTIDFFDRFSRCNGLSPDRYEKTGKNQLLYDPVY